jgi:cytochrome c oxidase subunit 4
VAHGDAGQVGQAAHAGHAAAEQPAAHAHNQPGSHAQGQQHPLGIYFKIWALLFVLSVASYLVDYFHLQGFLRWFLIVTLMLLKAGLIVAVFMHMLWERLALVYAIVVPPLLLLVLLGIGALEADYTFLTRGLFFSAPTEAPAPVQHR